MKFDPPKGDLSSWSYLYSLTHFGHLGAEFGPLRVNFSLELQTSATEFEYRPLQVDCGPLRVNLLRLWVDCGPEGVHLGPL